MDNKKKNCLNTINFIIFCDYSMVDQSFRSSQVKQWAIITYKQRKNELPKELPKDVRLRIIGY